MPGECRCREDYAGDNCEVCKCIVHTIIRKHLTRHDHFQTSVLVRIIRAKMEPLVWMTGMGATLVSVVLDTRDATVPIISMNVNPVPARMEALVL